MQFYFLKFLFIGKLNYKLMHKNINISRSFSLNQKSDEDIILEQMKQISSSGTSIIALTQTLKILKIKNGY